MDPSSGRGDVLVLDYDKTLADERGIVPQSAKDALRRWREAGGIVIDNTGRRAGDFLGENGPAIFPDIADYVDYVVAENGSVIIDVAKDRMIMLGERPPQALIDEIAATFSPSFLSPYRVQCIKTADPTGPPGDANEVALTAMVDRYNAANGTKLHVAKNIDSLMVLPEGIDKRIGMAGALALMRERGQGGGRVVGAGDATNDLPFLDACDISFGVDGGARLASRVDFFTTNLMGEGVRELADTCRGLHGELDPLVDAALKDRFHQGDNTRARTSKRKHAPMLRARADIMLSRVEKRAGVEIQEKLGLQAMAERTRNMGLAG